MNSRGPGWWVVNIGSGNGLEPPDNKTLPEFNTISDALGHNELIVPG